MQPPSQKTSQKIREVSSANECPKTPTKKAQYYVRRYRLLSAYWATYEVRINLFDAVQSYNRISIGDMFPAKKIDFLRDDGRFKTIVQHGNSYGHDTLPR